MKTSQSKEAPRSVWDEVRETTLAGMRDLKDRSEELARLGRLRMDEAQSERRLHLAHENLGRKCHELLSSGLQLSAQDPSLAGLCERVQYYQDELNRLRSERIRKPETAA